LRRYLLLGLIVAMLISPALALYEEAGDVEAFRLALEEDGFTVQEGELGFFDFIQLYEKGVLPSVYGNNPSTKYLGYFVPPAPGYELDPRFVEIAAALNMSGNASSFWNLGPDEAVVFVGRTPPECRYFSFDHYLMSRTTDDEAQWIFSNIADTVNNLVINTGGAPGKRLGNSVAATKSQGRAAGEPFNQTTMIVSTADRGIDERIRAAARSAGYSEGIMNTQVFPTSMLRMGLEDDADTFGIFIRPALFTDKEAGAEYINNTPATVFRVTPTTPTDPDPYGYPVLRVRGTGQTEFDLTDDLNELRTAILGRYGYQNAMELPTAPTVPVGSEAIQRGIDAVGPTNDAAYLWTADQTAASPTPPFFDTMQFFDFLREPPITLADDTNEFFIVYGVNHAATGKATYTNFALYGADIWNGIGSITDADFTGSAADYLPGNPNAKYLYVYKVARDCEGDEYCFEVPYGVGGYGIELDQPIFIVWRVYLEEATQTGPSYAEIVYDRAIKFS